MKTIKLPLEARETKNKLASSQIPGVIYGKEIENVHVSADVLELKRIYKEAGSNSIVDVEVGGTAHEVLFKDMQVDPVYGEPVHFDLYAIIRGQKVSTDVPVVLVGDSPAIKTGLLVNTLIDSVTISTTPKNIPQQLEVSVESLVEIDDTVKISDIKLTADDMEITGNNADDVVAKVEEVKEMQVEDPDADKEMPGEEGEDGEAAEGEGSEAAADGESSGETSE